MSLSSEKHDSALDDDALIQPATLYTSNYEKKRNRRPKCVTLCI